LLLSLGFNGLPNTVTDQAPQSYLIFGTGNFIDTHLQLLFLILSDHQLQFQQALQLPTFESEHQTLLKRLTLIVKDGVIETVHYPVFPSDADAKWAMAYLKSRLK
jgi:peroxiredoxin